MAWHLTKALAEMNDGSEAGTVKNSFYSLSLPGRIKRIWYSDKTGRRCKKCQVMNDFCELLLYCWAQE